MQLQKLSKSLRHISLAVVADNRDDILAVQGSVNSEWDCPPSLARTANQTWLRSRSSTMRLLFIATFFLLCSPFLSGNWLQPTQAFAATVPKQSSTFEKGIVYPRYTPWSYGSSDVDWQSAMKVIKPQTAAKWIEMPVLFEQPLSVSTTVSTGLSTPTVASFTYGLQTAHALGYKVFFVPLMAVRESGGWAGTINPKGAKQQQAWFDSYWNTLTPYIQAAANNGVEQIAIGTELKLLEQSAPPALWNQLITRIRTIYKNELTYDMNFSSLDQPVPAWLANTNLAMIGVSSYFQLISVAKRVDPKNMAALWHDGAKVKLDAFAARIKKTVLISEIGYRNSSDAFYQPWSSATKAPPDPQEQAGAFDAALSNVTTDPNIGGIFVWGWDDAQLLSIKDLPLTKQVLYKWYSKP